ncbi:MAG: GNAT family N-acetyltransferase, partial [Oscillospiraceae bacterium]|nr:GNAT family N-acetyltransferase [Oscillospiraceae bacterium]
YELFKDFRGKGYMTEAVNTVCDYCFDQLRYDYLTCGYFDGNTKSKGVMERCGFTWLKDIDTAVEPGKTIPGKLYIRYKTNK